MITRLEALVPVDTRLARDHSPSSCDEEAASDAARAENDDIGDGGDVVDIEDRLAKANVDNVETDETPAGTVVHSSHLRRLVHGMLPWLALVLAVGAGYLAWQGGSARIAEKAAETSVHAAIDSTVAMLAYRPDSVEKDLSSAADNLTGKFREEYTRLINEVVIPGSKEKHISSVVAVPAAATMSATGTRAEVLVFVNQTILVGDDAPTFTASTVHVTLERIHDRWLISQFEPI